jgi:hypothetical protein
MGRILDVPLVQAFLTFPGVMTNIDLSGKNGLAPSSSGPGHGPFTAATRVRISSGSSDHFVWDRVCPHHQAEIQFPQPFRQALRIRADACDGTLHRILQRGPPVSLLDKRRSRGASWTQMRQRGTEVGAFRRRIDLRRFRRKRLMHNDLRCCDSLHPSGGFTGK